MGPWVLEGHLVEGLRLKSSYLWVKRDFHKNGRDLFDLSLARDQLLWWRRDADVRHFPAFSDWIFSDNNVYRHSLCRLQILNKKMFFRFFFRDICTHFQTQRRVHILAQNSLKIRFRVTYFLQEKLSNFSIIEKDVRKKKNWNEKLKCSIFILVCFSNLSDLVFYSHRALYNKIRIFRENSRVF